MKVVVALIVVFNVRQTSKQVTVCNHSLLLLSEHGRSTLMDIREEIRDLEDHIRDLMKDRQELLFRLTLGFTDMEQEIPDNVVHFPSKERAHELARQRQMGTPPDNCA